MVNLGLLYRTGSGVKLDKKKAEELYRTAADRGHAFAQTNLAILLDSEKKFEEAFRYYALAADQDYTDAELNLGCCYINGEGTEVDPGKARYWFERAAAKGDREADALRASTRKYACLHAASSPGLAACAALAISVVAAFLRAELRGLDSGVLEREARLAPGRVAEEGMENDMNAMLSGCA
ncbi:hypothetical protein JL721_7633 [Aureococcus anophagefferens]|nr:hypothetical protein JL721_7633 [Aureococcus anophagefferens]